MSASVRPRIGLAWKVTRSCSGGTAGEDSPRPRYSYTFTARLTRSAFACLRMSTGEDYGKDAGSPLG